jgi:hypothetical protein
VDRCAIHRILIFTRYLVIFWLETIWALRSVVDRPLCMRKVEGSIPSVSNFFTSQFVPYRLSKPSNCILIFCFFSRILPTSLFQPIGQDLLPGREVLLKRLKPFTLTKELLNGLWALQSPRTSPWNIPFH